MTGGGGEDQGRMNGSQPAQRPCPMPLLLQPTYDLLHDRIVGNIWGVCTIARIKTCFMK
ncbi:MAG TPA: hypothetical protein VGK10_15355 [Prolixibacteraceae bacterium]